MLTRRLEYFTTPPSATLRQQIDITKALLQRVQSFCKQKESDLVVLSIPQQFQVLAPERAETLGVDVDAIDRIFAAFSRERGFTWFRCSRDCGSGTAPTATICTSASTAISTLAATAP
jgi:hypothetical protein